MEKYTSPSTLRAAFHFGFSRKVEILFPPAPFSQSLVFQWIWMVTHPLQQVGAKFRLHLLVVQGNQGLHAGIFGFRAHFAHPPRAFQSFIAFLVDRQLETFKWVWVWSGGRWAVLFVSHGRAICKKKMSTIRRNKSVGDSEPEAGSWQLRRWSGRGRGAVVVWWAEPVVGGRGPTTWGPTPKTWRSKPSASPWPPSLPSCRRPPPTQWRSSGGLGHPGGPSHQLAGRRGVLTEVTVWRGNMTWDLRSVTDWVTQEWPEGKQGKACGCAHVMVGDIGQPCNLSSKLNESGSTFLTCDRWQLRQSLFQLKVDAELCILFELPHIYSTLTKYRGWITFKCQLCWGFIDIASPVILSKCCHPRRRLWAIIESMISTDHVLYYIYNILLIKRGPKY